MREFTEQELVRREKAENLRALGLDPFGHRFDVTSNSKKIKEQNIMQYLFVILIKLCTFANTLLK